MICCINLTSEVLHFLIIIAGLIFYSRLMLLLYWIDALLVVGCDAVKTILESKPKTFDTEEASWQSMLGGAGAGALPAIGMTYYIVSY